MTERSPAWHLAQVVIRGIAEGRNVEIDGLGSFVPDVVTGFRFLPRPLEQVFIAYVKEDCEMAGRLYDTLQSSGFSPWMDERKLIPGQNWPRAIEAAIETSDFFIACFSQNSVNKKGGFQSEIRYALDCARQIPLDEIFVVPVRLNPCRVPARVAREVQYVDLFPDWDAGLERLNVMLRREAARRKPDAKMCGDGVDS
jgi:hypothetical protein